MQFFAIITAAVALASTASAAPRTLSARQVDCSPDDLTTCAVAIAEEADTLLSPPASCNLITLDGLFDCVCDVTMAGLISAFPDECTAECLSQINVECSS